MITLTKLTKPLTLINVRGLYFLEDDDPHFEKLSAHD